MTAPTIEAAHDMGANGSPPVEAERLAFEAWMKGHCWSLCATWRGTQYQSDSEVGGHLDPFAMRTRELWAAWRDRAALAGQSAPSGSGAELVLAMENTKNDAERAALWPRLRAALLSGDAAREAADAATKGVYSEYMLEAAKVIGTDMALRLQIRTLEADLAEARAEIDRSRGGK